MHESRIEPGRAWPPAANGTTSAGGPPDSFEDAYLRFGPLLRKIAIRKFRIPPSDAENLVHDVFATFFISADEVTAVERYLVGGICNASRNYRRRSDAAKALFCGETPCAATPPDALRDEVERKILLRRILGRVGSRCRELLQRYYVVGETSEAVAEAMQFKRTTVLVYLQKCRKRALLAYQTMSARSE